MALDHMGRNSEDGYFLKTVSYLVSTLALFCGHFRTDGSQSEALSWSSFWSTVIICHEKVWGVSDATILAQGADPCPFSAPDPCPFSAPGGRTNGGGEEDNWYSKSLIKTPILQLEGRP